MVFNCYNTKNLREILCATVVNVFGDENTFLDFIENNHYNCCRFDVIVDYNDENYIIDRETGRYLNWYKFPHIGRDCHTNIEMLDLFNFLTLFKNSGSVEGGFKCLKLQ